MRVEQLTCSIGAELTGVSLADAIHDDGVFAGIREALLRHRVLFLRDQEITAAEHVAFARRFGELEAHPVAGSDPEHPGLVRIYKDPDQPSPRYENAWHTDATWREAPPLASVLRCRECPSVGGDTMWANMVLAHENLPGHLKAQIADLRARHSIEASFGAAMPIEKRLALKAQFPDAEHPVVRTHPVTGKKALYVNRGFTKRLVGVSRDEGTAILQYLYDHAENPLFQCRFRWQPNSIAFWDNRCVQHRAMWDYWPHTRSGFRVTVAGDKPF